MATWTRMLLECDCGHARGQAVMDKYGHWVPRAGHPFHTGSGRKDGYAIFCGECGCEVEPREGEVDGPVKPWSKSNDPLLREA
jgi:hypothetical protein